MNNNEYKGFPVRSKDGFTHLIKNTGESTVGFYCGKEIEKDDFDLTKTIGKSQCVDCVNAYLLENNVGR